MNSNNQIHIWDLGTKVNVKVNSAFIDFINNRIKEKFITKRSVHQELIKKYNIPFSVFKNRTKRGYTYFVDLEIIVNLCNILDIPLEKFERNIIAYKTRKGSNYIENPKLPIKITPLFDMLIAHFIGDGFVINPKSGRKPYFGYRQYNEEYRNLFLKKAESIFGKINYKDSYIDDKDTTQVYFPVVCSGIMFKLYGLNLDSFMSETARIPSEIFHKDWKYKLAFLLAIIIDEGHIDSSLIVVGMKNKRLIQDLQQLCFELSYTTSMSVTKGGSFCLYLLSKSMQKFYQDYRTLINEYPEANLGYKGKKIEEFINRINKPKVYIEGNKTRILEELSKGNLTVNELATKLNMTRQGARYLIKELIKENKIEVKSVIKFGNYKYGLGG